MSEQMIPPIAALDSQASIQFSIQKTENETEMFVFQGHGFELQNVGILVAPHLRCEVVENLSLCPLPGTAQWLVGMAQLRGRILPVFDMQSLIEGSTYKRRKVQKLLVIEPQQNGMAIVLPNLPVRMEFMQQQILENRHGVPEALAPYTTNLYYHEKLWIEVDFRALFLNMSEKLVVTH